MRPDDRPTDPRLFPTEPNFTADLDAKALDEILRELNRFKTTAAQSLDLIAKGKPAMLPEDNANRLIKAVIVAVRTTGRKV